MKVTSADCKDWIIDNICPASEPADWKRRSKRKEGDTFVREFENIKVNVVVEVVERGGGIIGGGRPGSKKKVSSESTFEVPKSEVEFLYDMVDSSDDPGMIEVSFTTVECWESKRCQVDVEIPEVSKLMGIGEDGDNFYLVDEEKASLVKKSLEEDVRFGVDPDFTAFMGNNSSPALACGNVPSGGSLLAKLQANPIKVDLVPLDFTDFHRQAKEDELEQDEIDERLAEFSGRVVYALENYTESELDDADELCFTCGPETKDGWLDDSDELGCYDKLTNLFADFPTWSVYNHSGVDVGAAENFHEVEKKAIEPHGISFRDAWDIVKDRLKRSGAVLYSGGGGG